MSAATSSASRRRPTRESELTELTRDYDDAADDVHRACSPRSEDSKIAANLERRQIGEQFKMLDPARLPEQPFSPNRLQINLIGVDRSGWRSASG